MRCKGRVPPRQSSLLDSTTAAGGETSQTSIAQQSQVDTQKLKLLNLWKHAYLDELAKIPGLLEFIDIFKDNYVILAPSTDPIKSRRAISMVLPKTIEGKEFTGSTNANKTITTTADTQQQIDDSSKNGNDALLSAKSNTSVQTSFDLLPQFKNEQKQKNSQHLQNISIVKTPLSRLKPCTRTAEQKRLDYEKTIAELKKQAVEVENRIAKKHQIKDDHDKEFNVNKKIDWKMDDNNNKKKDSKYFEEEESEIEKQFDDTTILPPFPPPPVISSSKYSMLKQKIDQSHLPTAEELILRVNQLPYGSRDASYQQQQQQFISGNDQGISNTTSTVRVQTQFTPALGRTSSGNTTIFSHHHFPSQLNREAAFQQEGANEQAILNKEVVDKEKNRAYQRVPTWSTESALISRFSSSEKDTLHEQFARMSSDQYHQKRELDDEKQQQFESKESLIIEESASENEEDSSAAIYKKIIISLRNSTTDLADSDYQFTRHSSHHQQPRSHQYLHRHTSSSSSSQQQHPFYHQHSTQSTDHHHQQQYEQYYAQIQQLHQLQQQQQQAHPQEQPGDCYFQSNEYSAENVCDEQELISAFSSMSRSEPSSARQSRKY